MGKYTAKKPDSNGHIDYTSEEDSVWAELYERQDKVIQGRACQEFIDGLAFLDMPRDRIPQCAEVNDKLSQATGWSVEPVEVIIPLKQFFTMLANKQFPAASFIRTREDLDYLQEPDIFHELFGHCPLLVNQAYADFMEWYGKLALSASKHQRKLLGRIFWFTIEFGLIKSKEGLRIFGGGILSSKEETVYALESDVPDRVPFHISDVIATDYRYDEIQNKYFVLENMDAIYDLQDEERLMGLISAFENGDDQKDFVIC